MYIMTNPFHDGSDFRCEISCWTKARAKVTKSTIATRITTRSSTRLRSRVGIGRVAMGRRVENRRRVQC